MRVEVGSIQDHQPGAADLVILSKTAVAVEKSTEIVSKMSELQTKILVDLVDGSPGLVEPIAHQVDAYICASLSEHEYRKKKNEDAFLVHHHVDSRIAHRHNSSSKKFSVGYAGRVENAQWLETLPLSVHAVDSSDFSSGTRKVERFLREFTHHYSVRKYQAWDGFKPGTKAFLAAHLGAVFIGSSEDYESQLLLGGDYPYLSTSSNAEDVKRVFELARVTFGTEMHRVAQRKMEILRRLSCRASVTLALHSAITTVLNPPAD
jgi:hypothetical protein